MTKFYLSILFLSSFIFCSAVRAAWLDEHLRDVERLHLTSYRDTKKHTAIGYGHQNTGRGPWKITKQQAEIFLAQDIKYARGIVRTCITVPMTPGQYDALTSLAFNIGKGRFCRSTLVARFNAGDVGGAGWEFTRWVRSDGRVRPWLIRRRAKELKRYWGRA